MKNIKVKRIYETPSVKDGYRILVDRLWPRRVNNLIKRGYTTDFSILAEDECLVCQKTSLQIPPDEFEIDEIYRFEGMTDPGEEMIVFAITSVRHQIKGTIVNAFGIYSDVTSSKIVERLNKDI